MSKPCEDRIIAGPAAIDRLKLYKLTETSYEATWKNACGATNYVVTLREGDNIRTFQTRTESIVLLDIDDRRDYVVQVQSENEVGRSKPREERITARPNTPKNIKHFQHPQGYTISWDKVKAAKNYQVEWTSGTHNGNKQVNSEECYLSSDDLNPGRTYQVKISSLDGKGNASNIAMMEFHTAPCRPSNISIKYEQGGIIVEFEDDDEAQNTYEVVAEPIGGGEPTKIKTDIKSSSLTLQPGVDYSVSVYAIYGDQRSAVARYDKIVHTVPAPIEKLTLQKLAETTYEVTWLETEGATNYIVTLHDGKNVRSLQTTKNSIVLHDVSQQQSYVVRVESENDGGKSKPCEDRIIARPEAPKNVRYSRLPKGYNISWDKVQSANNYDVEWTSGVQNGKKQVSFEDCFLTEDDLKPGRSYRVKVCALDVGCNASEPATAVVETAPSKPSNIRVKYEEGGISIEFHDDPESQNSYEVVAEPISGGEPTTTTTDIKSASLALQPGVDYKICVYAVYCGRKSHAAKYDKLVHTGPAMIDKVDLKKIASTIYKATWKKAEGATSYVVTLQGAGNLTRVFEPKREEFFLQDIAETQTYVVGVQAKNDVGISEPCQTTILGIPAGVEKLAVVRQTSQTCKVTWKKSVGATKYKAILRGNGKELQSCETDDLECEFHDFDATQNLLVEVRAVNEIGCSSPRKTVVLATPKHLQMTLISVDKVEIQCENVPGATKYEFIIGGGSICDHTCDNSRLSADHREDAKVNDEAIFDQPLATIKLYDNKQNLTVKIRALAGDESQAESEKVTFRNVIKIVQQHFKRQTADIFNEETYMIPEISPKATPKETFESCDRGKTIVLTGGHFCGKTSLCAYWIQKSISSDLVIFVDADEYVTEEKLNIRSFFKQLFNMLREDELEQLISWMDKTSKDIVFVIDNAPNPTKERLVTSISEESNASTIIATLMSQQKSIFPQSRVLCASSQNERFFTPTCSKVFKIQGLNENQIESCREKYKVTIPKSITHLCRNPGFCMTVLQKLSEDGSTEKLCLGDWLIDVLSELTQQVPAKQRKRKVSSIVEGIHYVGGKYDISPSKLKSGDLRGRQCSEESCKTLQEEYEIILHCTYVMSKKDFKTYFSHQGSLDLHPHSRKWEAIAGLLGKGDVTQDLSSDILRSIKKEDSELIAKQKIFRKFIKGKKSDLKRLKKQNPGLSDDWDKCIAAINMSSM